jgi:hypothetical protein
MNLLTPCCNERIVPCIGYDYGHPYVVSLECSKCLNEWDMKGEQIFFDQ